MTARGGCKGRRKAARVSDADRRAIALNLFWGRGVFERAGSHRLPMEGHYVRVQAKAPPGVHQLTALLEDVVALVRALNLVVVLVCKSQFENLAREVGFGCAPGPCAGPEAMYGDAMAGGVLAFSGGQICAQLGSRRRVEPPLSMATQISPERAK